MSPFFQGNPETYKIMSKNIHLNLTKQLVLAMMVAVKSPAFESWPKKIEIIQTLLKGIS